MDLSKLSADTDLCVKCGLCLPHCPTYTETLDENESPRGRIALIQGWARGGLQANAGMARHVDNCLLCRACESVCPAYVPYGSIIDRFRGAVRDLGKTRGAVLKTKALRTLLAGSGASGWRRKILVGETSLRLRGWLRRSGLLRLLGAAELDAGLPDTLAPADRSAVPNRPADAPAQAALFLGCTAELLDAETLVAVLKLDDRLGLKMEVPGQQVCCGALHCHGGDPATAAGLARQNMAAFSGAEGAPIVGFASGCTAMLLEYPALLPEDPKAGGFAERVRDVNRFFAEQPWPADLKLAPLDAKVCVHTPCSLRHQLRSERYPMELLKRIPGLSVAVIPPAFRCCGAAGSYQLEHPDMAQRLREPVLDRVIAEDPALLVTSNPGCAAHLRAGLKQRGRGDIEVLHPVSLLARQLDFSAP